MNDKEARKLTDKIKSTVDQLHTLFLRAYEERAWEALGYLSWREYVSTEFDMSESRAYQILDHGEVIRIVEDRNLSKSEAFDNSPNAPKSRDLLPNTGQTKQLMPVFREAGPEAMLEVWDKAVESTKGKPTAKAIKSIRSQERCAPIRAVQIPTPFKLYRDKITALVNEIYEQHDLNPAQAKALGRVLDALEDFVRTATAEDDENYDLLGN
jgi:hypothetical protein